MYRQMLSRYSIVYKVCIYHIICIQLQKGIESCSSLLVFSLRCHLSTSGCLYIYCGVTHSFTKKGRGSVLTVCVELCTQNMFSLFVFCYEIGIWNMKLAGSRQQQSFVLGVRVSLSICDMERKKIPIFCISNDNIVLRS